MFGATRLSGLVASIHDAFRVVPIVDWAIFAVQDFAVLPRMANSQFLWVAYIGFVSMPS
jgi:Co/Zn/Cd efflux system component